MVGLLPHNEDDADCIKLHVDAGSSQTITTVNDEGTNSVAAVLLLQSRGITLSVADEKTVK